MADITSFIGTYCETKKTWRKRFAGIANDSLSVYKVDASDDVEDLNLDLTTIDSFETVQGSNDVDLHPSISSRPYAFVIHMTNDKSYFFDCRTEELLHEWLGCLEKYMNVNKKTPRPRTHRQSVLMQGMKLWKDDSVYRELIEAIAKATEKHLETHVDLLNEPLVAKNSYIKSFIQNRKKKIDNILSTEQEETFAAYLLLDFIKNTPATQFVAAPSTNDTPPPLLPKESMDDFESQKPERKKPRRIRPKKNMKKIFNKLAKTASGRNVFETKPTLEKSQPTTSSSTLTQGETNIETNENKSIEQVGENAKPSEENFEEKPAPSIDFDQIEKKRGKVLSNPKLSKAQTPPALPPKPSKQTIQNEDKNEDNGEISQIDEPPKKPIKRKARKKKRTAPTRKVENTLEMIDKVDSERGTLTKIARLQEESEANYEQSPNTPSKKVAGGVQMMGFSMPSGDLRSVLKKRNQPPFANSPKSNVENSSNNVKSVLEDQSKDQEKSADEVDTPKSTTSSPPELPPKRSHAMPIGDFRSVLKRRSNPDSASSETLNKKSPPTSTSPPPEEFEKSASPTSGAIRSNLRKRESNEIKEKQEEKRDSDQFDFRRLLRKRSSDPPKDSQKVGSSGQFDFRSVLKKREEAAAKETQERDSTNQKTLDSKQYDFRSVLKKRASTDSKGSS